MAKPENELTWKDLETATIVTEPGNASGYQTGTWRSQRPIFDNSKCNKKCTLCYIFCPEGCMGRTLGGYFEADLFYCKGCGICAEECPTGVITMVAEKEEVK